MPRLLRLVYCSASLACGDMRKTGGLWVLQRAPWFRDIPDLSKGTDPQYQNLSALHPTACLPLARLTDMW